MAEVRLRERKQIAKDTMAFHFERPRGFDFDAGQFVEVTLIEPPETDWEGNRRSFTLASAPFEQDLMVATRLRDTAFKRVLRAMPLGAPVGMEGPFGSLTLHQDGSRPAVFLAGGIGITPFRSISLEAARDALPHRLYLFYSNRHPEDAAFLDELERLERENSRFTFVPTVSQAGSSSKAWSGRTGRIDRNLIEGIIGRLDLPIYYVAGPPGLVSAMREMLRDAGVPSASVRAEEFTGY